jgi:hypothetical protein
MSNSQKKQIRVLIERDESSPDLFERTDESRPHAEPTGFRIIDNGVGFNDENLRSFDTCFSTYKQNLGAKGIGRFSWLKTFEAVQIESVFQTDEKRFRRTFDFNEINGVANLDTREASDELQTIVRLKGFRRIYRDRFPKKARTIAEKILEHCLAYFILDSAPEILVDDPTENQTISLSELFAVDVKGDTVNEELEFEQEKLQLTHLRRYSSAPSEHVIHLCADQREVCQL